MTIKHSLIYLNGRDVFLSERPHLLNVPRMLRSLAFAHCKAITICTRVARELRIRHMWTQSKETVIYLNY